MGECSGAAAPDWAAGKAFEHLLKKHPCFNEGAHYRFGRIHLPVSPSCNIQCRFCKRSMNKTERRPGVTSAVLTPEAAEELVGRALKLCPDITVVGIAGPGDTLATPNALATFERIRSTYPHLISCLSTNGLLLEENAERLADAGVKTITVTVNAVREEILAQIVSMISIKGQMYTGTAAAEILIRAQLAGIHKASRLGAVIKVNTVLIPGVNDHHIQEVAAAVYAAGATMMNIIPLIPQHEMADLSPPDCSQLNDAREAAEKYLPVFRHCKQCRADAIGVPGTGQDLAGLLYDEPMAETFSHG